MPVSAGDSRRAVEELYDEVVNRRHPEAADRLISPSFMDHTAPAGMERVGPDSFRSQVQAIVDAVPDASVILDDIVAEQDRVAARLTWRGTLRGTLRGAPPSGQPIVLTEMVFWRLRDGQLAERWAMVDEWGLRRQIDAQFRLAQPENAAQTW